MAHAWRWWLDMTTEDFRGLDPAETVALLPVAAVEQHGPHLPLDTDTRIAVAVAQRVGADLGHLTAPAIAYGASGEHQGFPGTVSIGTAALTAVLVEYGRSACDWASRPPKATESRMPGSSVTRSRRVSCSDTGTMSDSISWKPSARRASTASERLSFAGARTMIGGDCREATDGKAERDDMTGRSISRTPDQNSTEI